MTGHLEQAHYLLDRLTARLRARWAVRVLLAAFSVAAPVYAALAVLVPAFMKPEFCPDVALFAVAGACVFIWTFVLMAVRQRVHYPNRTSAALFAEAWGAGTGAVPLLVLPGKHKWAASVSAPVAAAAQATLTRTLASRPMGKPSMAYPGVAVVAVIMTIGLYALGGVLPRIAGSPPPEDLKTAASQEAQRKANESVNAHLAALADARDKWLAAPPEQRENFVEDYSAAIAQRSKAIKQAGESADTGATAAATGDKAAMKEAARQQSDAINTLREAGAHVPANLTPLDPEQVTPETLAAQSSAIVQLVKHIKPDQHAAEAILPRLRLDSAAIMREAESMSGELARAEKLRRSGELSAAVAGAVSIAASNKAATPAVPRNASRSTRESAAMERYLAALNTAEDR